MTENRTEVGNRQLATTECIILPVQHTVVSTKVNSYYVKTVIQYNTVYVTTIGVHNADGRNVFIGV